jgi:hypothetical protein
MPRVFVDLIGFPPASKLYVRLLRTLFGCARWMSGSARAATAGAVYDRANFVDSRTHGHRPRLQPSAPKYVRNSGITRPGGRVFENPHALAFVPALAHDDRGPSSAGMTFRSIPAALVREATSVSISFCSRYRANQRIAASVCSTSKWCPVETHPECQPRRRLRIRRPTGADV